MKVTITQLAGCIIPDPKGRILLIHRETDSYNHWEIPGGKVEHGETSQAAAKRELLEELNLHVFPKRELGEARFTDKERQFNYVWWLATTGESPQISEPHLFTEWRYFSIDELLVSEISLSEGAKMFIALVKTGKIKL